MLGGTVGSGVVGGEYGHMPINIQPGSTLYSYQDNQKPNVWMSHGDEATKLPDGFRVVAKSEQVRMHGLHRMYVHAWVALPSWLVQQECMRMRCVATKAGMLCAACCLTHQPAVFDPLRLLLLLLCPHASPSCCLCFCPCPTQGAVVAIENAERRIFGLQYHPEVMHTEQGTDTIRHFLLDIAGLKADWTMAEVLETQIKLIEQQVRRPRQSG
jgi:hypothetical protein